MSAYPDTFNPDLADRIPLSARSVLDVGCGSGALGMEFRRRNPAAIVVGIERDPRAAAIARGRIHHLIEVDLERGALSLHGKLSEDGFDCIVYGNVLEHLQDPWSLLQHQAQALAPDGTVLVCMPNIEHWTFIERLLRGKWGYQEQGLFDHTHLRWFNPETTRRALLNAGLFPVDVTARAFDVEHARRFVDVISPALKTLNIDPETYLWRAGPMEHVWRARRCRKPLISVLSTKLDPVGGVSEVRVAHPMKALASDPGLVTQIISARSEIRIPEIPQILLLHRPALVGDAGVKALRELLRCNSLVVCEFDDHPAFIPVLQRPDVYNFTGVHAVQTSTAPLAALLRTQNPEVAVFPNAVARLPDVQNFRRLDQMVLFFGGINRDQDWPPLLDALNAVASLAQGRLFFRIIADRGLFEALETPHKQFTPLCGYPEYLWQLSQSEICLMPLADTEFNRCKSDLKFLEASAYRVASLASTVVYENSVEDGRTGLLFRSGLDLQQSLIRMIAHPEATREMANAARAHVAQTRMMAYQVSQRVAWYRSLIARRDKLHRALLTRMPTLAEPVES